MTSYSYDLYTVAGNQARLVVEQALRERFLPFYGGTVTFIDGAGCEHEVTARRCDELYDRDNPSPAPPAARRSAR